MIWSKEVSFEEFGRKVSEWHKTHDFLGDAPIDAQFALDLIFKTLIDDKEHLDYLTTMPGSIDQSNGLMLDVILWKYSRSYRKWKKKKQKEYRKEKWL